MGDVITLDDAVRGLGSDNPLRVMRSIAFIGAHAAPDEFERLQSALDESSKAHGVRPQFDAALLQQAKGVVGVIEALSNPGSREDSEALRTALYNSDPDSLEVRRFVEDDLISTDDPEWLAMAIQFIGDIWQRGELSDAVFGRLLDLAFSSQYDFVRKWAAWALRDALSPQEDLRRSEIARRLKNGDHRSPWWRFRDQEDQEIAAELRRLVG